MRGELDWEAFFLYDWFGRTHISPDCALREWASPRSLNFLSPATVSRLSISCLINCHYLAGDKKKGGREMHFRIKMESETSLKSEVYPVRRWARSERISALTALTVFNFYSPQPVTVEKIWANWQVIVEIALHVINKRVRQEWLWRRSLNYAYHYLTAFQQSQLNTMWRKWTCLLFDTGNGPISVPSCLLPSL